MRISDLSIMKFFVTSDPTWTRVSQKPMDCMIKVNQKHLLPLIPLVVGERKKESHGTASYFYAEMKAQLFGVATFMKIGYHFPC